MSNNNVLQQSNAQPSAVAPAPKAAPSFLQKKGLLGGAGRGGGPGSIVSPTDNVLSPCSAKLNNSKQRHFQKGKPLHLTSQLSQLAASGSNPNAKSDVKIDF